MKKHLLGYVLLLGLLISNPLRAFISPDPEGHVASMDLYSYCNGDPINQYDADGRVGKGVGGAVKDTAFGLGALAYNGVGSAAYGITSGFGYYNNSVSDIYADQWQGLKNVGNGLGNLALQLKNQDFKSVGIALTGGDDVSVGYRIGYTAANIGGLFLGGEGIAAKIGSFSRVGGISDGFGYAAKESMFISNLGSGGARAMTELLDAMRLKGRTITIATQGSEELRFLNSVGAEASVGGSGRTSIILRENPSKVAAMEEFLHGTQERLGIIDRLGIQGAEDHVANFMDRHRTLLGLDH